MTERLEHELAIIQQLGYADYFLVVWDLVRARQRGILAPTRFSSRFGGSVLFGDHGGGSIARRFAFERFLSLEQCQNLIST